MLPRDGLPDARLFFDLIGNDKRQLDFRGALFAAIEQARKTAELICLDLAVSEDSPWIGAEIQVRDETGHCVYTLPVRQVH